MERVALDKLLFAVGYYCHEDENAIMLLVNPNVWLTKDYSDPFEKELNANLLSISKSAKEDMIKFYITEFFELQGMLKQYHDLLYTGSLSVTTHTSIDGVKRELTTFEQYVVRCNELIILAFDAIQRCCWKFDIDFEKMCETRFDNTLIDYGVTMCYNELKARVNPKHKVISRKYKARIIYLIWGVIGTVIGGVIVHIIIQKWSSY